jgi:uncharacterized surface protein with fasciclin (FAS1) repeats
MRLHSVRRTYVRCAVLALSTAFAATACGKAPPVPASPTGGAGPVISVSPSRSPSPTPSTSTATSLSHSPSASPSTMTSAAAALVGADCAMFPPTGNGSISFMHAKKAITAASSNQQLTVFVAAVRAVGLEKTLNSRHSYTLIIPANSAFASLSRTQVIHLHKSGNLRKVIRYHTVQGRLTPQRFASGARPATPHGKTLALSKTGPVYQVNGATVLCGNITTSNATIYIIDKVLLPPR